MITEAQTINPDGIIEFFQLDFTTRLTSGGSGPAGNKMYFTNEQDDITFQSQTYTATTCQFRPPEHSLDTNFPKGTLVVHGQNADLLLALNGYNQVRGSTFYYYYTHRKFLDDGSDPQNENYSEVYIVEAVKQRSKDRVELGVSVGLAMDRLIEPAMRTITS